MTSGPATQTSTRVEIMDSASRCRDFNKQGRQCGNYTKRTVVVVREGREDVRRADCGRH